MMVKSTLICFGFIKPSSGLYNNREKLLLEQKWMFLSNIIIIKRSIVVQATIFLCYYKVLMKV